MKKSTLIIAAVLVFVVIAVVIFLFMRSNQQTNTGVVTETITTKSGVSNVVAQVPDSAWNSLIKGLL